MGRFAGESSGENESKPIMFWFESTACQCTKLHLE